MKFDKKRFLVLSSVLLFFVASYSSITIFMSIPSELVHVYYNENCKNTEAWAAHMDKHGFKTKLHIVEDINEIKDRYMIPESLRGCHTAVYDGYAIEGHVPAQSLQHFYNAEVAVKSNRLGLAVKGYPVGGAGLEGGYPEVYEVFSFDRDSQVKIFEKFNQSYHQ